MKTIGLGDTVYWARCYYATGTYDLIELHIRTIYPDCFVGCDPKSGQAFILGYNECDETVFDDRDLALAVVRNAEKNKRVFE